MSGFLLDTNVLSKFNRRGAPDRNVEDWLTAADPKALYASVITFGEIRFGIELLPPGRRRTELEQWFERDLHLWFAGRLLPVDEAIAAHWASLTAARQQNGKPLSNFDGLLAATALHQDLTMVTRNTKDFEDLGLTLFNPWIA